MIRIEHVETYGWEAAIRGMRNPKNSWDKSDSICSFRCCPGYDSHGNFDIDECELTHEPSIGENDLKLMKTLGGAGAVHGKFMRMITVTLDITAPLYWWKEFDTYKVGTVANSCSTMHKIHAKKFERADFSTEHLLPRMLEVLDVTIFNLNACRGNFLETKDKKWWWQMIQLLPTSYNQRRTIQLNYEVLRGMYAYRQNHKLDEWRVFCKWIETLPHAGDLLVGEAK